MLKELPRIIQGGMGASVSNWRLARAVACLGQLGVVSGTALDVVLARRLQMGDPGGHINRALEKFPFPQMARQVWEQYFVSGGKKEDEPFKPVPMHSVNPPQQLTVLTVIANFVEVCLAREGHDGPVGINFLEKIQLPTLPSLYGAMLAGAAYVLMGAGIPRAIPGIMDDFAAGRPAQLRLDVVGAKPGLAAATCIFDPNEFCGGVAPQLERPRFLGIISSATLAMTLARKSSGRVDGFIVEGPTAGGHNAPPRGVMELSPEGEPVYGERDAADLDKIRDVGLPFWLAGSFGRPGRLAEARALGAVGIQVGTAFAFCEESGLDQALKVRVLKASRAGQVEIFTDPFASPTGFPFKVVQLDGTLSSAETYSQRRRICDLGYLRHPYVKEDGSIGYRCPSEPVDQYLRKGGLEEDTVGRKCVCNGLLATASMPQFQRDGSVEAPLVTAGNDVADVARFLRPGQSTYTAAEVIDDLLAGSDAGTSAAPEAGVG